MGYENTILKCEAAPNKELNRSPLKAHTLKRLVVNIHKMFIYKPAVSEYQQVYAGKFGYNILQKL